MFESCIISFHLKSTLTTLSHVRTPQSPTNQQKEIEYLKSQLAGLQILLDQNQQLEEEVERLMNELDTASSSIIKRGYLFKWREKEIGWAARWGLRYFTLQGSKLSYYSDDSEHRPRATFDLSKCVVRLEGTKKNGTYKVFSIFMLVDGGGDDDADDENANIDDDDESPRLSLVLRLSTESLSDAEQWIDMLEQACAYSELKQMGKPLSRANSFAQFTIGELTAEPPLDGDSLDLDLDNLDDLDTHDDLSPIMLQRVKSSNLMLKKSASRSTMARQLLAKRSPSDFSASGNRLTDLDKPITKFELDGTAKKKVLSSVKNLVVGGTQQAPKNSVRRAFPGSKPMHTKSNPSPLSNDVRPGEMNYRGFFNLAIIILFLSHARIIVDTHTKHGFVPAWQKIVFESSNATISKWAFSKPGLSFLSWVLQLCAAFRLEKFFFSYKDVLSERFILFINFIFGIVNIVVPTFWCMHSKAHPGARMAYIFQAVIIWMKLISYSHANRDLRQNLRVLMTRKNSSDKLNQFDDNMKPIVSDEGVLSGVKDLKSPILKYPQNLTLKNLVWFSVAPTLTYQLNYPASQKIRWPIVVTIVFRMLVVSGLILFSVEQYIMPTLNNAMIPMHNMDHLAIIERILKLSIPNTYVWLLVFYFYFHLWLNLLAELTCFGDRMFYRDWWNARTIESYWRNWNLPVHHWMLRHLYYPVLRTGAGKHVSTFVVFLFSAVFHELIISTPFRRYSMHAFMGMLAQAPLSFVTKALDKRFDNAFFGNVIFWMTFCVLGQPMGILLMAYEHWEEK